DVLRAVALDGNLDLEEVTDREARLGPGLRAPDRLLDEVLAGGRRLGLEDCDRLGLESRLAPSPPACRRAPDHRGLGRRRRRCAADRRHDRERTTLRAPMRRDERKRGERALLAGATSDRAAGSGRLLVERHEDRPDARELRARLRVIFLLAGAKRVLD